jgi:hypothetical protein
MLTHLATAPEGSEGIHIVNFLLVERSVDWDIVCSEVSFMLIVPNTS